MKKIGEDELEKRVAYEVSVSKLEIPTEEEEDSSSNEAVF
jgi:hypothetical protein